MHYTVLSYTSDGEGMARVPKLTRNANSAGTLDGYRKKYNQCQYNQYY
jgi:hypothetical protein